MKVIIYSEVILNKTGLRFPVTGCSIHLNRVNELNICKAHTLFFSQFSETVFRCPERYLSVS